MRARDQERLPPWRLTGLAASAGLLLTLGVIALPFLRFAYRAPELHVALETTAALTALVVGFLVYGRFRSSRSLQELLLALALTVAAVANLLLAMLPSALGIQGQEVRDWGLIGLRLLGTLLLTAAALTPASVAIGRRGAVSVLLGLLGVLGLVGGALLGAGDLPAPVDPGLDLSDTGRPLVLGHPLVLAAQLTGAVAYAVAAVAFTRQAGRRRDQLLRWLGAACALSALSRVNYFLFPSLYSDFVYTGDLLRFGFYLLLLVGAAREVQSYWQARAQAAVLEDRRRMARDLHDGLTQELTYIWSQTRLLAAHPGDVEVVDRINGASARALDEARTAIAALTRTATGSFADVLRESVEGLAGRYGAQAKVEAPSSLDVTPEQGDALLRIVAEAFRNAVRHGGANLVEVTVTPSPLALVVRDDGSGFDRAAPGRRPSGFGLTSMRERAEALGARFDLRSAPGSGTVVEVRWS